MAFSASATDTFSSSKSNFTLLALNSTFTLSFSTPFNCFTAFSIFCAHDGQLNVSNCSVAFFHSSPSFYSLYFSLNTALVLSIFTWS